MVHVRLRGYSALKEVLFAWIFCLHKKSAYSFVIQVVTMIGPTIAGPHTEHLSYC